MDYCDNSIMTTFLLLWCEGEIMQSFLQKYLSGVFLDSGYYTLMFHRVLLAGGKIRNYRDHYSYYCIMFIPILRL